MEQRGLSQIELNVISKGAYQKQIQFDRDKHIRYFCHCLHSLPSVYSSLDTNRITLVHFAVQSLDLLGALENKKSLPFNNNKIIEWIYSLLAHDNSGFKGGSYLGPSTDCEEKKTCPYEHSHIAMTYTALCTLVALGDDLSRIKSNEIHKSIVQHLPFLQRLTSDSTTTKKSTIKDKCEGSFHCLNKKIGSEHDMRFLYCACSVCYMLHDWSGVDTEKVMQYIKMCHTYDGAFALVPGQEGHGGSTFCAVASLYMMDKLHILDEFSGFDSSTQKNHNSWRKQLLQWCIQRQMYENGGIQGRPNKYPDTCYSYWVGATLSILQSLSYVDTFNLSFFVLENQSPHLGGFSKIWDAPPDLLHSFYSIAWLSIHQHHHDKAEKKNSKKQILGYSLHELDYVLGIRKSRSNAFKKHFGVC